MGWCDPRTGRPLPLTHRQFLVWRQWLQDEWNEPDRGDHYVMALRAEVQSGNTRKAVPLEKMKLPFTWERRREPTAAERAAADLGALTAALGGRIRRRVENLETGEITELPDLVAPAASGRRRGEEFEDRNQRLGGR